jgi:hypothetical protein
MNGSELRASLEGSGLENPPAPARSDRGQCLKTRPGNRAGLSISAQCNSDGYICENWWIPIDSHYFDARQCVRCGYVEWEAWP